MTFYKLDSVLFSLSCAVSDAEILICHALQGIIPESVLEERREKQMQQWKNQMEAF